MLSFAILMLALSAYSGVNTDCVGSFGGSKEYYQYQGYNENPPVSGNGAPPPSPPNKEPPKPAPKRISSLPLSGPQSLSHVYLASEVAKPTTYPPLRISVNKTAKLICSNGGAFVVMRPASGGKVVTLTGGPANDTYEFRTLGESHVYDTPNARASTLEDGVGFPAQIRLVMYKAAYGNYSNALNYPDGFIFIPFNILSQGVVPNKLAQPYCNAMDQLAKFNSTATIGAWEALEWLLISLESGYYVHPGSYIDDTLEQFPCVTIIQPSFTKHAYVSKQQYKSFVNLQNQNGQPEIVPLAVYPLAGREVCQGNGPVSCDVY